MSNNQPLYASSYTLSTFISSSIESSNEKCILNPISRNYPIPVLDFNSSIIANTLGKNPRRKFSPEEDERLRHLVATNGRKKWEAIARKMPGRTGRQCRDRYQNYLVPGFFNGQWTKQEDELLMKKYKEIGSKWSKMSKFFEHRNANALKNRWNYFISQKMKKENIEKIECNQKGNEPNDETNQDQKNNDNKINQTWPFDFIDFKSINENNAYVFGDECSELWI